ncbi:MAG: DUF3500 domain-containing protein [Cyclobacteriaceae bacterium]|nr:DUF3500 domain-containing protein [Cyclobacteriaceae bacterium SS2]
MNRILTMTMIAILAGCTQTADHNGQAGQASESLNAVKERFARMEADALKKPYHGIFTTNDTLENLFSIKATNVTTAPIIEAANNFLVALSTDQRQRATFQITDQEWRKWSNVDNGIYDRQGVSLKEMDEEQKKLAFDLMRSSLSAKGLQLSKDIMKTDQTLRELNDNSADYDEELYFFTLMGTPSDTAPWGWQIDGHHLVINYFVLGDQVVMSPVFMGGEPIFTTSGKYKGNTLFQDEQNMGLAFMQSLSDTQQVAASITRVKTGNNNVSEANKDNLTLDFQGIQASSLSASQRAELLELINQYISNMREGHKQVKMEEVIRHIENTWFSWVGETKPDAVFYYRIHSPVVLIEFDHQRVVGVPNTDDGKPSRNHIHTVVRAPNGNDYGKDLLRQHLANHQH